MTAQEVPVLRWSPEEFVDAWDAGAFGERERLQLVDGEVWDLGPINAWHGQTTSRLGRLLWVDGVITTTQTLPMPHSMPDPDTWVLRDHAEPIDTIRRFAEWDPEDVLLVVEVSDSTVRADLTRKAHVYARGGVRHYWVLARDALHVHTEPLRGSYQRVEVLGPDEAVALPYAPERVLAVRDLVGA